MASVHTFPVRIYFEDTDAGGVVYHASYIRFAERARTELLRDIDFQHSKMIEKTGCFFVVRQQEINYLLSAKLDDFLQIKTCFKDIKRSSVTLEQEIFKDEQKVATICTTCVCINSKWRATRIPPKALEAFERFEKG